MPRWFLSYHSPDQKLAERMKGAIELEDPAVSVIFAPTGMLAGGAWFEQLANELDAADAFILLIGNNGVGKWQRLEYAKAYDRRVGSGYAFPLIIVLLEGPPPPTDLPFLEQLHRIVTPDPASKKDIARIFAGASGRKEAELQRDPYVLEKVRPLTTAEERALKLGTSFKEGADRPEMIVVPAGRFLMGSLSGQGNDNEGPQHEVTIAKPFAVAKFALTFDEWDAFARGAHRQHVSDSEWGRGRRPVINVNWNDAKAYVEWLSNVTGKPYRLLSEAEYEYAAGAGSRIYRQTKYPWGDNVKRDGKAMANCNGCGSRWDGEQTAPVGSFPKNAFGLYDTVGNVWEWTEDCWNPNYQGAPVDGSPWTSGFCESRAIRGGSFNISVDALRFASRSGSGTEARRSFLGFRVARTLTP